MNQVAFVGRLTRKPSLHKFDNDQQVLNNTLAIERPYRDRQGEKIADFIPIVAWGRMADIFLKHTQKGDLVAVSGQMQSRRYENKEGQTVYVVECLVSQITLLNNRRREESSSAQDPNDYSQVAQGDSSYDQRRDQVAESLDVPGHERVDQALQAY